MTQNIEKPKVLVFDSAKIEKYDNETGKLIETVYITAVDENPDNDIVEVVRGEETI